MFFIGSIVGLTTALFTSLHGLFLRKHGEGFTTLSLSFFQAAGTLFIMVPLFLVTENTWGLPSEFQFWKLVAIAAVFELIVIYAMTKAYILAEQSLVAPLFGLSVIFLIPIDFFLLGTNLTVPGVLSALLIIIGSFLMSPSNHPDPYNQNRRGVMWMVIAAFFAACAVATVKSAYNADFSPIPFAASVFFIETILLLILVLVRLPLCVVQSNPTYLNMYPIVMAYALTQLFHYVGISLMAASYFIGLERSSIIFSVIFGHKVLDESPEVIAWRYTGAVIIFAGVLGVIFTG